MWSWATSSRCPCLSRGLDQVPSRDPFQPQPFYENQSCATLSRHKWEEIFVLFCVSHSWLASEKTAEMLMLLFFFFFLQPPGFFLSVLVHGWLTSTWSQIIKPLSYRTQCSSWVRSSKIKASILPVLLLPFYRFKGVKGPAKQILASSRRTDVNFFQTRLWNDYLCSKHVIKGSTNLRSGYWGTDEHYPKRKCIPGRAPCRTWRVFRWQPLFPGAVQLCRVVFCLPANITLSYASVQDNQLWSHQTTNMCLVSLDVLSFIFEGAVCTRQNTSKQSV